MSDPDIDKMTRHLEAVLARERREAMAYTIATVLCTPAFVVIGALFVALVAVYIISYSPHQMALGALTFYTAVNAFLAYMVAGTMRNASSAENFRFDTMWMLGAVLFVALLILTYATSLLEGRPIFFGVTYAIVGFLILGFVSQVLPAHDTTAKDDPESVRVGFALAIPNLITSAYRELLSASWLWFPPTPGGTRIAAMVLCRLATNPDRPLGVEIVEGQTVDLLSRLKLVQVEEQHLCLTPKGLDFVQLVLKE